MLSDIPETCTPLHTHIHSYIDQQEKFTLHIHPYLHPPFLYWMLSRLFSNYTPLPVTPISTYTCKLSLSHFEIRHGVICSRLRASLRVTLKHAFCHDSIHYTHVLLLLASNLPCVTSCLISKLERVPQVTPRLILKLDSVHPPHTPTN